MFLQLAWPSHCEGTEPDARIVEIVDDRTYIKSREAVGSRVPAAGFAGLRGWLRFGPILAAGALQEISASARPIA